MRVLVTGATGFIGTALVERLHAHGHDVVVATRNVSRAELFWGSRCDYLHWSSYSEVPCVSELGVLDGVIHLAGETVVGRWTAAKRQAIQDSRQQGTARLVEALGACEVGPKVLVSASAIGYYGDRGDEELHETSLGGDDFLAEVCQHWESEAAKARSQNMRVASLRTGIVLGPGAGALQAMRLPFSLGMGGPLGSGNQWWSWVHRRDVVSAYVHLLETDADGVFNCVAPQAERQGDFARKLGRAMHRPAFMPAPAFALKAVLGGFSAELLSSKKVMPTALLKAGFEFQFKSLDDALLDLF